MTAVELSSDAGLVAMVLLTANILLGLVLSARYNTLRSWPHRRLPVFDIHNWTAYIALAMIVLHPVLLLSSGSAHFRVIDVLFPVNSPHQTLYNNLGAMAFYCVLFVVVTSYFARVWAAALEKTALRFLCRSCFLVCSRRHDRSKPERANSRLLRRRKGSGRSLRAADRNGDHLAHPLSAEETRRGSQRE